MTQLMEEERDRLLNKIDELTDGINAALIDEDRQAYERYSQERDEAWDDLCKVRNDLDDALSMG